MKWLTQALDARPEKPALVMMHHDPIAPGAQKKTGLLDTELLLSVLLPRRHVKALFFGHTHIWKLAERDGLHLVNLPAMAYVFSDQTFTGWTHCRLRENGMSLESQAHDQTRPEHGKVSEFTWRT